MKKIILFLSVFVSLSFAQESIVNTAHLDYLYQQVKIDGKTIGFIHIYADAPEYKWTGDDDEGIACVDDAARAAVLYMMQNNKKYDAKIKGIMNFLIRMQADNGFFYNFIWQDYSINKTFRTSVAEPNFWAWRAMWALAKGEEYFAEKDKLLSSRIEAVLKKAVDAAYGWINKDKKYVSYGGYQLPAWLPYETGADQASVLVKALSVYYKNHKDEKVKVLIEHLCDGLLMMQHGEKDNAPYGAFFSWQNTWHAWGNSQADALIDAGRLLNKKEYIDAAVKEIKYFYPYLAKEKYYASFAVDNKDGNGIIKDTVKFHQIAYGFRPVIFASLNAYEVTGDTAYLNTALEAAKWFAGGNIAGIRMYDPATGRGYDGMIGPGEINKNSGAESTIESLFSITRLEKIKAAKNKLSALFNKK